jgi:hypothetical protein
VIRINADAFLKSMREARKKLSKAVYAAVRRAAKLAADHARKTTLFKDNTGDLRRSIKPKYINNSHAQAVATSRHAEWVERGNGFRGNARYIYPKRSPFLIFKVGNRTIFAKKVRTTQPRPFMDEAGKFAEPAFIVMCQEAVSNMFT